jgi:hypothetical protein
MTEMQNIVNIADTHYSLLNYRYLVEAARAGIIIIDGYYNQSIKLYGQE